MMKVATLVLEKTCLPADELQAVFLYSQNEKCCVLTIILVWIRQNTHTFNYLDEKSMITQPESFPLNTAAGQDNIRGLRE